MKFTQHFQVSEVLDNFLQFGINAICALCKSFDLHHLTAFDGNGRTVVVKC